MVGDAPSKWKGRLGRNVIMAQLIATFNIYLFPFTLTFTYSSFTQCCIGGLKTSFQLQKMWDLKLQCLSEIYGNVISECTINSNSQI